MKGKRRLTPERAALVALHIDVADKVARKFIKQKGIPLTRWPLITWEDAHSAAYEALCNASFTWNVDRGSFRTYAYHRVWYAMTDWLRQDGPMTRGGKERIRTTPWISDAEGPGFGDHYMPTEYLLRDEERVQDHADLLVGRQFVNHCLSLLPPREAYIIRQTMIEGRTLAAIGRELGLTESRVSQLQAQAIQRLRRDDDVVYAFAA